MANSTTFLILDRSLQAVSSEFLPLSGAKVDPHFIKIACSNCNMRELCMPIGLDADELKRVEIGRAHV